MFKNAISFNDISSWDVSSVVTSFGGMSKLFYGNGADRTSQGGQPRTGRLRQLALMTCSSAPPPSWPDLPTAHNIQTWTRVTQAHRTRRQISQTALRTRSLGRRARGPSLKIARRTTTCSRDGGAWRGSSCGRRCVRRRHTMRVSRQSRTRGRVVACLRRPTERRRAARRTQTAPI